MTSERDYGIINSIFDVSAVTLYLLPRSSKLHPISILARGEKNDINLMWQRDQVFIPLYLSEESSHWPDTKQNKTEY